MNHLEKAIQSYLAQLRRELRNVPRTTVAGAVADAEEFLRSELHKLPPDATEMQALEHFEETFGAPAQIAAEYADRGYVDLSPNFQTKCCAPSKWKPITVCLLLITVTTVGVCYAALVEPPKLSPFTRVEFEEDRILVAYEGETKELLAVDDIPIEKIVDSAKQQFEHLWQKRIAEDLVEVLWGMKHHPGQTVELRLRDPETHEEQVVAEAPMTEANRQAIWLARNAHLLRRLQDSVEEPPKLSPFTSVEFEPGRVLVEFKGDTRELLAIDGISIERIIASAKEQFGILWKKRIAEDLVEVLWGMDHRPGETVELRLRDPQTHHEQVVAEAQMTRENRQKIWWARHAR